MHARPPRPPRTSRRVPGRVSRRVLAATRVTCLTCLTFRAGGAAHAQTPRLELLAGAESWQATPMLNEDRVGVRTWGVRVRTPRVQGSADVLTADRPGERGFRADLAATLWQGPRGFWLGAGGAASRDAFTSGVASRQTTAWLGAGRERPANGLYVRVGGTRVQSPLAPPRLTRVEGGVWRRIAGARWSLSGSLLHSPGNADSVFDSAGVALHTCRPLDNSGRTACRRGGTLADLGIGVVRPVGPVVVALSAGGRRGDLGIASSVRTWRTLAITRWVTRALAVDAGAGRQPPDVARALPARTVYRLGLHLVPDGRTRDLAPAPTSDHEVDAGRETATSARAQLSAVRDATGARLVCAPVADAGAELRGDLTGWRAVALVATPNGACAPGVDVAPGVYGVQIRRADGPWRAPDGLARQPDGFGGESGVLVVEP